MGFEESRSKEDRPKKRRKKGVKDSGVGRPETRKTVGRALVGRYVKKEFVGIGVFLGKIVSYCSGLYRIDYEDGDCEDLDSGEIRDILLGDGDFDEDLNARKVKLDQLILGGDPNAREDKLDQLVSGGDPNARKDKLDQLISGGDPNARKDKLDQLVSGGDPNARKDKLDQLTSGGDPNPTKVKLDQLISDGDPDTRKEKSDQLISVDGPSAMNRRLDQNVGESANDFNEVETSSYSKLGPDNEKDFKGEEVQLDGDADSSSDSCEHFQVCNSSMEIEYPSVPPPALPSSSGNIGVPEESVSHLLSVYSFLRAFSIQLFLSPFGLDDFVGALNCVTPNTLLDAIHVALLSALRRHLQNLSSDGVEVASKCLRRIDWSLLDSLTWPVYLVEYFLVMGHTKGRDWKGFYDTVLNKEFYTLPVDKKLVILQILCDNIIESAEIRAEIDMRENSEVGTNIDGLASAPPDNVPRRVHPRYSKTSACKDSDLIEIISEPHELKPAVPDGLLGSKAADLGTNVADVELDGNSDECQLCGMDGTLICCDGCPSAYHSRCIGMSKMHLPEGSWFCHECTINKMAPTLQIATGLRGAEVFGIDPYEQVFLGSCNHLLVLNASMNAGTCSRYYSQIDIPKVLQALRSSVEHNNMYAVICNGIIKYWKIPHGSNYSLHAKSEIATNPADEKEEAMTSASLFPLSGHKTCKLVYTNDCENCVSSLTENNMDNATLSRPENGCQETGVNCTSFVTVSQVDSHSLKKDVHTTTQLVGQHENKKFHEQLWSESTMSSGSVSLLSNPSDINNKNIAGAIETATCTSGDGHRPKKENGNGVELLATSGPLSMVSESTIDMIYACSYMGSNFKPQNYVNQYVLGDVAASAAANLAVLSSAEMGVSESRTSSNTKKLASVNISLQNKAFSSAVFHFFWPNSEKKMMEVPRERCGWCYACKAANTSKGRCLLNLAASNALKAAAVRISGGFRLIKSEEGNLTAIAAYMLYMEESLCGLTVGPFLNSSYRGQWRKQVEQATTCTVLKSVLLELEENIRVVAFSGDWFKLVDDWSAGSFVAPRTMCFAGSTQKRGVGGRRSRKQSATSVVTVDPCQESTSDVSWWRGGKLFKMVFQRGILPRSITKKAARQGGSRKISGIYYTEGSEIPRRSRQFAWRAAVEMTQNVSQLALQVRYLDLHVRWSDLVCPDQSLQDSKGSETEASAFRNALVCDKKAHESKIMYGLCFPIQKHLPSRVMKNVVETELSQDEQRKFWFSEFHIPVYLIKKYEEKVGEALVNNKDSHMVSKLQRRQMKALRRDIFNYLMLKRDNLDKSSCVSCHKSVLFRYGLKCGTCQGYCHKDCIIQTTANMKDEVEFLILCNQCYQAKVLASNEKSKKSMVSKVLQLDHQIPMIKGTQQNGYDKLLPTIVKAEKMTGNKKPSAIDANSASKSRRGAVPSYGLIKKKKNSNETGATFRANNILFRGSADMKPSLQPICSLCFNDYNFDLMYICCEQCGNWYHADAVQLKESEIFDVVGFRCNRCRKKSSPRCPYMNSDSRKACLGAPKPGNLATKSPYGIYGEQSQGWEEDDSLNFSLERVVPISESTSEVACEWNTVGVQKLPVRRQVKHETILDSSSNLSQVESDTHEANIDLNETDKGSSSQGKSELPVGDTKDEMFDYENLDYDQMDYEPQTYFSFTELLASEENQPGCSDPSLDIYGAATSYSEQEPYTTDGADNCQDMAPVEPVVNMVPCQQCHNSNPAVDLFCENCEIRIHKHCSPWVEHPSVGGKWKCGNCREWR